MKIRAQSTRALLACALVARFGCTFGCSAEDPSTGADASTRNPGGEAAEPREDPAATSRLRPVALCDNAHSSVLYAPENGVLDVFPDDYFTTVSADTATGRRVALSSRELALPAGTSIFHGVYDELSTQDGFGVTAQLVVRFAAQLDLSTLPGSGPGSGRLDRSVLLINLDADPIEPVDLEWELVDDSSPLDGPDQTLLISPLSALEEHTHYGLAITTGLRDLDGGCIAPSPTQAAVLQGRVDGFDHVLPAISTLVGALEDAGSIDDAGDLTLAVSFQTQSVSDESVALSESARARAPSFSADGPCENDGTGILTCRGVLSAADYRGEDGIISELDRFNPVPVELPITAWVPADAPGPFQTVIFGHGLGGDREQAQFLADQVVPPRGDKTRVAVIAADAPMHGQHPDCRTRVCPAVLPFFGARTTGGRLSFSGLRFRDNLRQANLDKQHIVAAILSGLDVTDDGAPDFDQEALHYVGGSLGGIMGGEFAAMTPELQTVSLLVPGARLVDVVREIDAAPLLFGSATDGDLARLYPVLQTAFDRGDPGAHARSVLGRRTRGTASDRPHLLMQVALGDAIVPNRTSVFYARTLGLAVVGDPVVPVPGAPRVADFPVALNLENSRTAGFYGFDVVCVDQACSATEAASHQNVAFSDLASIQVAHFVDTWIETGVPEIIDVYRTEGVK